MHVQARDDFFHLILESTALKTTHGFRRAKELFEEDPRWKVGGLVGWQGVWWLGIV